MCVKNSIKWFSHLTPSRISQARSSAITMHSITWLLITHTCTSSAPSIYKHTPHTSSLSDLVSSKWTNVTCLVAFISYLPPVSSPACSSQLYSIVRVSQDFHESVPIVQDCEVCAPVPLFTSSSESKGTSIITLIVLLCLFIELVTHLLQLPADSTDYNKTHLLYSTHL